MTKIKPKKLKEVEINQSFYHKPGKKMMLLVRSPITLDDKIICSDHKGNQYRLDEEIRVWPVNTKKLGSYELSMFTLSIIQNQNQWNNSCN